MLMRQATAIAVFVCRLSWFISVHFVAVHSCGVRCIKKIAKNHLTSHFGGLKSFEIIDVDTPKKLVTSACYDTHHYVCAYLQPFSR